MTTLPKCWSDNSDESDVDSDDIFDESSMIMARTSVGRRGKGGCDLSDHATARGCGKDEPTRDVPNSRRGSTYKTKKYRTKSYMTLKEDNDQFGMHEKTVVVYADLFYGETVQRDFRRNYLDSVHGELKEEMKVELKEEMKNELKEEMRA
ncbi:hypothetical protein Tco_1313344 [Tanacetum coccineum]